MMDLSFIGKLINLVVWMVSKAWQGLNWLYVTAEPYLGPPGALILVFTVVFFPMILVFARSVSATQATIEEGAKFVFGMAIKIFAVFVTVIIILFILSSM